MNPQHLTREGLIELVHALQAKLEHLNRLKRERNRRWRARKEGR